MGTFLSMAQDNSGSTEFPGVSMVPRVEKVSTGSVLITVEAETHDGKHKAEASGLVKDGDEKAAKEATHALKHIAFECINKQKSKVMANPDGSGDDKGGGDFPIIQVIILGDGKKVPEGPKKIPNSVVFEYESLDQFHDQFDTDFDKRMKEMK